MRLLQVLAWVIDLSGLVIQPAIGLLSIIVLYLAGSILIPVIGLGGIGVCHPATDESHFSRSTTLQVCISLQGPTQPSLPGIE